MKSKQNIYKKELNLKYFVVSLDLVKKKLSLHHLSELEIDKQSKKPRKNFTLTNEEHVENIDKIKLKDLDIM